jgi:predicted secreted protein
MGFVSGIVTFLLIWWTLLFTVLPFSLRRDETGKPVDPQIGRKFLITTGISAVIWCVLYLLISMDVISFYDMATEMMKEDHIQ